MLLAPVRFGDVYPPVPDAVIEMLRSQHDDQGYISVCSNPASPFQPGDAVRLLDGSLKGF